MKVYFCARDRTEEREVTCKVGGLVFYRIIAGNWRDGRETGFCVCLYLAGPHLQEWDTQQVKLLSLTLMCWGSTPAERPRPLTLCLIRVRAPSFHQRPEALSRINGLTMAVSVQMSHLCCSSSDWGSWHDFLTELLQGKQNVSDQLMEWMWKGQKGSDMISRHQGLHGYDRDNWILIGWSSLCQSA